MKILNSVRELWEQCQFCPICQENIRTVEVDQFNINVVHWKKTDNNLKIRCCPNNDRSFEFLQIVNYSINCDDNSFHYVANSGEENKISVTCQISGKCEKCRLTWSSGTMLLNGDNKQVENICLDRESVYVIGPEGNYHVTLLHYCEATLLSKCYVRDDGSIDNDKVSEYPLVKLDFSKPQKVLNKVKTLILFS